MIAEYTGKGFIKILQFCIFASDHQDQKFRSNIWIYSSLKTSFDWVNDDNEVKIMTMDERNIAIVFYLL